MSSTIYQNYIKRVLDFVFALLLLILLSPLLLVVTIWLHFANKGAGAFFTQDRPGKDEKIFRLYKFKSMTDERDENGELLPNADRLTKVGKFIRATSIDELPQLWNVLRGDMSFIGPRPLLTWFLPLYDVKQRRRHEVRPGITGWAQVNGRNTAYYSQKFQMDVWYVDHLSLGLDLKILVMTVKNVFIAKDVGNGLQNEVDDLGWASKKKEAIAEYNRTYKR